MSITLPTLVSVSLDSNITHVQVIGGDYGRRTLCGLNSRHALIERPAHTTPSCRRCAAYLAKES